MVREDKRMTRRPDRMKPGNFTRRTEAGRFRAAPATAKF